MHYLSCNVLCVALLTPRDYWYIFCRFVQILVNKRLNYYDSRGIASHPYLLKFSCLFFYFLYSHTFIYMTWFCFQEPFHISLPASARALLRNTDSTKLRTTATRLHTIISKYNNVMKTMTDFEQPLFERSLAKIENVKIKFATFSAILWIISSYKKSMSRSVIMK